MSMLKYKKSNIKMATIYGNLTIDSEGKVQGLNETQEKELSKLEGFTFEESKKPEPKKVPKVEEGKKETPKKTTRKTTTRKSTTKKTEDK